MTHRLKMKKAATCCWILLLSFALLSGQGIKLHVHSLDHDHNPDSVPTQAATEHTHLSIAHLSTDVSHIEQHDQVMFESDAYPDALLLKISSYVPVMAMLALVFSLILFFAYPTIFRNRRDSELISTWRYLLSPPLRAPPCRNRL